MMRRLLKQQASSVHVLSGHFDFTIGPYGTCKLCSLAVAGVDDHVAADVNITLQHRI
jgi:hypothetical protein